MTSSAQSCPCTPASSMRRAPSTVAAQCHGCSARRPPPPPRPWAAQILTFHHYSAKCRAHIPRRPWRLSPFRPPLSEAREQDDTCTQAGPLSACGQSITGSNCPRKQRRGACANITPGPPTARRGSAPPSRLRRGGTGSTMRRRELPSATLPAARRGRRRGAASIPARRARGLAGASSVRVLRRTRQESQAGGMQAVSQNPWRLDNCRFSPIGCGTESQRGLSRFRHLRASVQRRRLGARQE